MAEGRFAVSSNEHLRLGSGIADTSMLKDPKAAPPRIDTRLAEGTKFDQGKDRWDLAPWAAFTQIIKVLTFGAAKYDSWNWAQGLKYSRVRAALQRHLLAFDQGIDHDEETGLLHLAHAGCCLVFLLTFQLFPARYRDFDDRFIFVDVEEGQDVSVGD